MHIFPQSRGFLCRRQDARTILENWQRSRSTRGSRLPPGFRKLNGSQFFPEPTKTKGFQRGEIYLSPLFQLASSFLPGFRHSRDRRDQIEARPLEKTAASSDPGAVRVNGSGVFQLSCRYDSPACPYGHHEQLRIQR